MTKWFVGSNMPGYMPDSEAMAFDTHSEAKASLIADIESDIEQLDLDHDRETDLRQLVSWAEALPNGHEFGSTANNRHYWLTMDDSK